MKKLLTMLLTLSLLATMLSVFSLPASAETSSGDYTYTLAFDSSEIGWTATITGYSGTATDVVIPSEIDGYAVTKIGQEAFYYRRDLRSVIIPESVKSIDEGAFLFCIYLTSANLPSGLESIGENAFRNTCLLSVDVPDGVTSIGAGAFAYCRGLSSVHIPSSVESIGDYAFNICARLESITVDEDNRNYSSVDGVLYNKNQTELICCPCGKQGIYAVPDSVDVLNEYGFMGLTRLEGVIVPENSEIMSTEDGVLFNKDKTELICYPGGKSDSSYAIPDGVESIDAYAFSVCENLLHVTIPGSVETIGGRAFEECRSLEDVIIEEGVKRVCSYAFEFCEELRSVTLPHSIETIDRWSFIEEGLSYRLKTVYYDGTEKEWAKVNGRDEFSNAEILFLKTEQDDFAPQNLQASTSTTGMVISWDAVDEASGYRLYRLNDEGQWQTVKTLYYGETEYLVTGLTAGKTYTFTVQAYRIDPVTGGELWSGYDETGVTATATFGAPVVTTSVEDLHVTIRWESVEGATGYRIYRQTKNDSWRTIAIVDDKATAFIDETAVPNIYYLYTVQACTVEDGKTVYSSCETNGTFARVILGAPTIESAVATEDGVVVSWTTVENATGYRLYRQTEDGWKTIKTLKGEDSTSFTDESRYAGVGSVYTVQAFYVTDGVVAWSGYDMDGESAISGMADPDDFTYVLLPDGTVALTGYTGEDTTVFVPSKIDGYTVTGIGATTFKRNTDIESVTIPDSVKQMEPSLFYGCTALKKLKLGKGMKTLPPLFAENVSGDVSGYYYDMFPLLEELILPEGLVRLETGALKGMDIEELELPQTVEYIGPMAFASCSIKHLQLPNGLKEIGYEAFRDCTSLQEITIPSGVTAIDEATFINCTSLAQICLPDTIRSIGAYAFNNTAFFNNSSHWTDGALYLGNYLIAVVTDAENYVVPSTVKAIAGGAFAPYAFNDKSYGDGNYCDFYTGDPGGRWTNAFCCNDTLKSVTLPAGICAIESCTFLGCEVLESITVPQGVTKIGNAAFRDCVSLASISLPQTVVNVGCGAFKNTAYINDYEGENVFVGDCLIHAHLDRASLEAGQYTLPEARVIAGDVFGLAFFTEDWNYYCYQEGICEYSETISCSSLQLVLPDDVEGISDYALNVGMGREYPIIKMPTIPKSVSYIGWYAFCGCSGTSLTIPDTVEFIDGGAFVGSALRGKDAMPITITVPDGTTRICEKQFAYNLYLTSLTIPKSVKIIEDSAFLGDGPYSDVYYEGSREDWKKIIIGSRNTVLFTGTLHFAEE